MKFTGGLGGLCFSLIAIIYYYYASPYYLQLPFQLTGSRLFPQRLWNVAAVLAYAASTTRGANTRWSAQISRDSTIFKRSLGEGLPPAISTPSPYLCQHAHSACWGPA